MSYLLCIANGANESFARLRANTFNLLVMGLLVSPIEISELVESTIRMQVQRHECGHSGNDDGDRLGHDALADALGRREEPRKARGNDEGETGISNADLVYCVRKKIVEIHDGDKGESHQSPKERHANSDVCCIFHDHNDKFTLRRASGDSVQLMVGTSPSVCSSLFSPADREFPLSLSPRPPLSSPFSSTGPAITGSGFRITITATIAVNDSFRHSFSRQRFGSQSI